MKQLKKRNCNPQKSYPCGASCQTNANEGACWLGLSKASAKSLGDLVAFISKEQAKGFAKDPDALKRIAGVNKKRFEKEAKKLGVSQSGLATPAPKVAPPEQPKIEVPSNVADKAVEVNAKAKAKMNAAGISDTEMEEARGKLQRKLDNGKIYIENADEVVGALLQDKTYNSNDERLAGKLGITRVEDLPVIGVVGEDDHRLNNNYYIRGNFQVKLKDNVKDRAMVAAQPVGEGVDTPFGNMRNIPPEVGIGGGAGAFGTVKRNGVIDLTDEDKPIGEMAKKKVEAQVYGGVKADDIEAIYVQDDNAAMDHKQIKALRDKGIKVVYRGRDGSEHEDDDRHLENLLPGEKREEARAHLEGREFKRAEVPKMTPEQQEEYDRAQERRRTRDGRDGGMRGQEIQNKQNKVNKLARERALKDGYTEEELEANAKVVRKAVHDNGATYLEVSLSELKDIANVGRVKAPLDGGKKMSKDEKEELKDFEDVMLGVDQNESDPRRRPVYGVRGKKDSLDGLSGEVQIKLKRDRDDNATIALGDGFDVAGAGNLFRPNGAEVLPAQKGENIKFNMNADNPIDLMNGQGKVKVQVWGDVFLDDIEEINVPKGAEIPEMIKLAGVKVNYI